jgi:hypothetical protein
VIGQDAVLLAMRREIVDTMASVTRFRMDLTVDRGNYPRSGGPEGQVFVAPSVGPSRMAAKDALADIGTRKDRIEYLLAFCRTPEMNFR